jgi:hypothetical protein
MPNLELELNNDFSYSAIPDWWVIKSCLVMLDFQGVFGESTVIRVCMDHGLLPRACGGGGVKDFLYSFYTKLYYWLARRKHEHLGNNVTLLYVQNIANM